MNCQTFSTGFSSGGLIKHQHGMGARIDRRADLLEVLGHGLCVAPRHHEAGALALCRADRPEQIGPPGPLIVRRPRPGSSLRPTPGDGILLPDAGVVLPPQFYGGADREIGFDRRQFGGKGFLKSATAVSLWA